MSLAQRCIFSERLSVINPFHINGSHLFLDNLFMYKEDLDLLHQQWVICYKTQPNQVKLKKQNL